MELGEGGVKQMRGVGRGWSEADGWSWGVSGVKQMGGVGEWVE